ncbi:MAG: zinc ribbon domain-containing protein [Armatimonadota bacterium]|nr:zinc ribbon domain-containing protein [Armatimonadota bacterium]
MSSNCQSCGAVLAENARFCPQCGARAAGAAHAGDAHEIDTWKVLKGLILTIILLPIGIGVALMMGLLGACFAGLGMSTVLPGLSMDEGAGSTLLIILGFGIAAVVMWQWVVFMLRLMR